MKKEKESTRRKREAIIGFLHQDHSISNYEIARQTGCSQHFIRSVRREAGVPNLHPMAIAKLGNSDWLWLSLEGRDDPTTSEKWQLEYRKRCKEARELKSLKRVYEYHT